ncbi:hypothetical protein O181_117519 [Austropuccinia psidii MF-1]|uniref:Integrase zinc-binding domain-containing protein n=1 Tax=Austropuccinia psidii MF-1 TaxID=1389203 RepID=A0A9Q3PXK6_9BASI|nr:hypothetical protein [Austropuccinia psidii MF-1]
MKDYRPKERVAITDWWPQWEKGMNEYINTCERCQKSNRKHEKNYGLLQYIEEPNNPLETNKMDWVTGPVPGGKEDFNSSLVIVEGYARSVRFDDETLDNSNNIKSTMTVLSRKI